MMITMRLFQNVPECTPDTVNNCSTLKEVYHLTDKSEYHTSVPTNSPSLMLFPNFEPKPCTVTLVGGESLGTLSTCT
jgi:hypothetical protein